MKNIKSLILKGSAFIAAVSCAVGGAVFLLNSGNALEVDAKCDTLVIGVSSADFRGTFCHSFEWSASFTDGRHRIFTLPAYGQTGSIVSNNGDNIGGYASNFTQSAGTTTWPTYGPFAASNRAPIDLYVSPDISSGSYGSPELSDSYFYIRYPGYSSTSNPVYRITDGNHEKAGYPGMLPYGILTYEPSANGRNPVLEIHLLSETSNGATFDTEVGSLINYVKYATSTIADQGWGSVAPLVRLVGDGDTPFQLTCSGAASRYAVIHCGGLSLENIDLTIDYDFNDEYKNGNTGYYTGPIILEETSAVSDGYIHSGELKIASDSSLTLNVGKTEHTVESTTMSAPGFGIWASKITILDGGELNINLKQPESAPAWNGYAPIVLNKGDDTSSFLYHYGKSISQSSTITMENIRTVDVSRDCFLTADQSAVQEKVALCVDNTGSSNYDNFVYEIHATGSSDMVSTMEEGYMHMSDYDGLKTGEGLGYCSDADNHYYQTAKEAISMDSFGDANRLAFKNSSSGAYARLQAWAIANGETAVIDGEGKITFTDSSAETLLAVNMMGGDNYAAILIAAAAVVALSSFVVVIGASRLKKKKSQK